jgi:hypothetical protein
MAPTALFTHNALESLNWRARKEVAGLAVIEQQNGSDQEDYAKDRGIECFDWQAYEQIPECSDGHT